MLHQSTSGFLPEQFEVGHLRSRARFSSCRAAHERKIEARVARSVFREMSIGEENYERSIIPLRSDISRFSRGTDSQSDATRRTGYHRDLPNSIFVRQPSLWNTLPCISVDSGAQREIRRMLLS